MELDITKDQMHRIRLERMDDIDESALYRTDERLIDPAGLRDSVSISAKKKALHGAEAAVESARIKTGRLLDRQAREQELHHKKGLINAFLIDVMGGALKPGHERFSEFLLELAREVHAARRTPQELFTAIELYIALVYGDQKTPRSIPYEFARTRWSLSDTVAGLTRQADEKTQEERRMARAE